MDTQKTPISSERRWYDKKRFVLPALFFFFPLGLALLWMGEAFQKNVKIGITIFFSVMFVWVALSPKEPKKTVVVNEEKQEVITSNQEGGTVQFDANGNEVGRTSSNKPNGIKITKKYSTDNYYENIKTDIQIDTLIKKELRQPIQLWYYNEKNQHWFIVISNLIL